MNEKISFVIVTGLSGAGKTKTVGVMEDLGYFCIDNLPPELVFDFIKIAERTEGMLNKICAVIDVRSGNFLDTLPHIIDKLKKDDRITLKVIFLEASTDSLVRRFSETRRRHPIENGSELSAKIDEEKKRLAHIKELADIVIDTSEFEIKDLKISIRKILSYPESLSTQIFILTFGYKFGIPAQADIVIDVRFIPNPFYKEELGEKNGLTEEVQKYVCSFEETKEFLSKFEDFLMFLVPLYIREGKSYLTIALGCTGGKHRSVAIGEMLSRFLKDKGYLVSVEHRDILR
ncbi:MAG: RNase adapter RapZ [Caldisericaceae bacterium]